jgi:YggT family protein
VTIVAEVAYGVLLVYFFVLLGRFVFDVLGAVRTGWKPSGLLLLCAEASYLVTDPPIRLLRRMIPTVRVGGTRVDFSWSILMLVVIILVALAASGFVK